MLMNFKQRKEQKLTEIKCDIYNKLVCHINTVCMTSHVVIKVVTSLKYMTLYMSGCNF